MSDKNARGKVLVKLGLELTEPLAFAYGHSKDSCLGLFLEII